MIYVFRNPKTGEVKEVAQKMSEKHIYAEEGLEWERVYTVPTMAVDAGELTYSKFMEKSRNMKGTFGDLMDMSKQASDKRAEKMGVDPVKEKYKKEYASKRQGKELPSYY